jgi:hypothetical protein
MPPGGEKIINFYVYTSQQKQVKDEKAKNR